MTPSFLREHRDDGRRCRADADNLVEHELLAVHHFPHFVGGFVFPLAEHLPDALHQGFYHPVRDSSAKRRPEAGPDCPATVSERACDAPASPDVQAEQDVERIGHGRRFPAEAGRWPEAHGTHPQSPPTPRKRGCLRPWPWS